MEAINYTDRDPFDVLVPTNDLSKTTKRRLNMRSPRTKWLNCIVFAYPEYNRIVVMLQKSGGNEGLPGVSKVSKFIVGADLSVITDTLNYKGMSNVLFLVGLFSEDDPHLFGKELVMSFATKEDRMLFIHEYEGKLRFTNYLGAKTKQLSRPNPEHCKALGRYLATIQNYHMQEKLAIAFVMEELERARTSESQETASVVTGELRHSNVQELLFAAKHETAEDRDYLGPYYVNVYRETLQGPMLEVGNSGPTPVSKKPWIECVLYGFVQTNRITLYHSTKRKSKAVEDGFESGVLWTLSLAKELVDVQLADVEGEERMPNVLILKNVIYSHGHVCQLHELVISFPMRQNRADFVETFPLLNACLSTETTEMVDLTRLLAQYSARLEEEKQVAAVLARYLRSAGNRSPPTVLAEGETKVGEDEEEEEDIDARTYDSADNRTAFIRLTTAASDDETSDEGFHHSAPRGYGSRVKSFLYSLFNSEHTKLGGGNEEEGEVGETEDERLTHRNSKDEEEGERSNEREEKEEVPEPPPKQRRRSLARTPSERRTREFIQSQAIRAAKIAEKTSSFVTGSTESVGEESVGSSDEDGDSDGDGEGGERIVVAPKNAKRITAISRPQSSVSQPYLALPIQRTSTSQLTTFEGPFEVHAAKSLKDVTVNGGVVVPVRGKTLKSGSEWKPCDLYLYPKPRMIIVAYTKKKSYIRSLSWKTESAAQMRCTSSFGYTEHEMEDGSCAFELHGLEGMQRGAKKSDLMLFVWDPKTRDTISTMLESWQTPTSSSQTDSLRESIASEQESVASSAQKLQKTKSEEEGERLKAGPFNARVKSSTISSASEEASTVEHWIHCSVSVDGQAQAIVVDLLEKVHGFNGKRVTFYRGNTAPVYFRKTEDEGKLVELTDLVVSASPAEVCILFESAGDEERFASKLAGWAEPREASAQSVKVVRHPTQDSKATFQLVYQDPQMEERKAEVELFGGDDEDEEEEKGESELEGELQGKDASGSQMTEEQIEESDVEVERRDSDSYFCPECNEVYDLHECEITYMLEDRALSGGVITCPLNHAGTEW